MIPLANAEEHDDKEREKQAKEEHTGEGPPRGEQRCHSNHKQSVQCLKTPVLATLAIQREKGKFTSSIT